MRKASSNLPPTWSIMTFAVLWILFEGFVLQLDWRFGARLELHGRPGLLLTSCAAMFLGIARVCAHHTYFRPFYRNWLALTPWNLRKALPLGPIHPTAADALLLAVLAMLDGISGSELSPKHFTMYVFWYSFTLCLVCLMADKRKCFHILLLAVCLQLQFIPYPRLECLLDVGVLVLSVWAGRRSLEGLPSIVVDDTRLRAFLDSNFNNDLGYPFNGIGPLRDSRAVFQRLELAYLGIMAGAWAYGLGNIPTGDQHQIGIGLPFILCFSSFRLMFYMTLMTRGIASPLGLLGRLRTSRLIIHSYDQVFLPPLALAVTFCMAWIVGDGFELPRRVTFASSSGLALAVAALVEPDFLERRLTAECRIIPSMPLAEHKKLVRTG